ncbi:DoxX family protein [Streptomyces sp. NPDC001617]
MRLYRAAANHLSLLDDVPLLVLRALIGWLMILHALLKINMGLGNFRLYLLQPTGLPFTGVLSWAVPTLEIGMGALLVIGLLARPAAAVLSIEMLFTAFLVKMHVLDLGILGPKGSGGAEVDLLFFAALVLLFFAGPGGLSVDAILRLESRPAPRPLSADPGAARAAAER